MTSITGLVLAAGLSSRFMGKIKGLTPVGPNGETLLHIALEQLKACGVTDLCVITSKSTYDQLFATLGNSYIGLPVTPSWRKKPLGTVHAVAAAASSLSSPFVIVNADTIYGLEAIDLICKYLKAHNDSTSCCTAYKLKNCLPKNGSKVNRAVITRDDEGWMRSFAEQYNISTADIGLIIHSMTANDGPGTTYSGDELTSLNIFGFRPAHLAAISTSLEKWLADLQASIAANPPAADAKEPEYILADFVNALQKDGDLRLCVLGPTDDSPLEITHPEDAEVVRAALVALNQ